MKKITVLSFIFFNIHVSFFGQNKLLDSLQQLLKTTKDIEQITNTYNNIGKVYNSIDTDSAIVYLRFAKKLAVKNNLPRHLMQAYSSIGTTYIKTGALDSAEIYFDKAKELLPKVTHYVALTSYYGDRGILDYYKSDYVNAGKKFEKALEIAIKEKNIQDIIRYSNNSGLVYSKTGNNQKALDIYYKALKSAEEQKDSIHIGMLLNNIANIYEDMNAFKKSLETYEKALQIKRKHGAFIDVINAHFNIANQQINVGELEKDSLLISKAKKHYDTVILLSNKHKYGNGKLIGWEGLGKINLSAKNYAKSKEYFNLVLNEAKKTNNKPYENMANLSLAYIEIELKNYNQAYIHLNNVKDFVVSSGSTTQKRQLYDNFHKVYSFKKDYKNAYESLLKLTEIETNLSSDELKDKISEYEVKYETEKKEKEISLQKEQLLAQELKIKNRNLYAVVLGAALLLTIIIFTGVYKQNQLKRNQLKKEIELKDALATIATQNKLQEQRLTISRDLHDNIGSQLTFIISSLDNLKMISKQADEKLKDKIGNISSFTSQTIHELRDTIWAMNKNEISLEDLQARILSFTQKAKSAVPHINFSIENNIQTNLKFTSVVGINIFRVVQEAINNAIKYADAKTISITLNLVNKKFIASVVDDGKGFDIQTVQLGNGLSNIEKRMSEIGGKAKINSIIKGGTTITLELVNKETDV